jgi:hypothetical protein
LTLPLKGEFLFHGDAMNNASFVLRKQLILGNPKHEKLHSEEFPAMEGRPGSHLDKSRPMFE